MMFCDDCGDVSYDYGDRVRLVQNHLLTGQVIGERNWGQEYLVRLGVTVTALWLERIEIEPDPDFAEAMAAAAEIPEIDDEETNVVQMRAYKKGVH